MRSICDVVDIEYHRVHHDGAGILLEEILALNDEGGQNSRKDGRLLSMFSLRPHYVKRRSHE